MAELERHKKSRRVSDTSPDVIYFNHKEREKGFILLI